MVAKFPLLSAMACFFAVSSQKGQAFAAISAPAKIINFTAKYLTNFMQSDQTINLTWTLANDLIAGVNKSQIGDDLVHNLTNSLTASQYTKLAQMIACLYPKFGSQSAITAALNQVLGTISKAVNSFYLQMAGKVGSMNAAGRGKNAKYLQVCRMMAQFLTQSNICIIMQAVKNNLSQSSWNNFRGCVDEQTIHWQNCGQ